ncbi:MAG TPA: Hsp20/alpha crystallin family protein [Leptolyngbyaceae cyanobacterium]
MLLSPWSQNPLDAYRQMEAIWSALAPLEEMGGGYSLPALELRETGDSIIVTAALPGVDPNQVQIRATAHSLTLSGRQQTRHANPYGYSLGYEQFQHTIPLPVAVQEQKVQVAFQEDTIVLTLPKASRWGLRQTIARSSVPTLEPWTLRDELVYQGHRFGRSWQKLKQWVGRQLHRLGDRFLEDW